MPIVIILAILAVIFLGAFVLSFFAPKRNEYGGNPRLIMRIVGAGALALLLVIGGINSTFTQDAGEAKVLKSFTGTLQGQSTTPGLHFKAPWVSAVTFDTRNNIITYVGDGSSGDNSGGSANGAQITFQDKEGVTGNLDIVVRYSVAPDAITDIYSGYQTQENFVARVIQNDVRSVARNIPAKYTTIEVYNSRQQIGAEILTALEERWEGDGIVVEEVSLQEIRYSDDVKARFDEAQAARIAVTKAEADQETARVNADTEVIKQQGVADANAILTASLTPEVLQQRYIDALAQAGAVFVVPDGSQPLVQVPGAPAATP